MVWPASNGPARRFRSPGGARSASPRPGLASPVPRPRLHEVGASSCAAVMSRMRAIHSAMHSSQVPEITSRRYSLPTCAMRARIRVFAAPRALLRRLYRVRLTVHHRRLTRVQLRHRCRVHYFVLFFIRLRVAEQNTTGRGSARVVIYYSGGYARQRRTGEPRGCGEYVYHRDWCLIPSGSSPRERGKHAPGQGQ